MGSEFAAAMRVVAEHRITMRHDTGCWPGTKWALCHCGQHFEAGSWGQIERAHAEHVAVMTDPEKRCLSTWESDGRQCKLRRDHEGAHDSGLIMWLTA